MKTLSKSLLLAAAALSFGTYAAQAAARPWLLPSETAFAGNGDEWVAIDAANSTDLFYLDHPAPAWDPVAIAPDGTAVKLDNKASGKLRIVFDLHMTQRGTYKIAAASSMVMGSYMLGGERKMLPRGTTEATLSKAIPEGATEVWSAPSNTRVETFVTAGEPTTGAFTTSGKGLEMVPVTHPSDLAVGEAATFQFLLDGKPAAGLPVTAIPGGVRYRADLKEMNATTDAQGKVALTWPEPGMYWVSVTSAPPRPPEGAAPPPPSPTAAPAPAAGGTPAAAGSGGPGERRMMTPPQRRDSYAMTVEVIG
jgi:hypothetical protein